MDTQRFSRIANGLKSASISSVTQTADALRREGKEVLVFSICLLYTSDAADEL